MKLKVGKYYRNRDGEMYYITATLTPKVIMGRDILTGEKFWFSPSGKFGGCSITPSKLDLVEELTDEEVAMFLLGEQK